MEIKILTNKQHKTNNLRNTKGIHDDFSRPSI